ncbi:DUF87 domain-containing protein, partial [Candidatus Wolfebacteria bacterium]|nr:DUF87 domain-containing protein [Candidatus Wolfebacteria bacterium]
MEKIKVPQPYTASSKDIPNVIAPSGIEITPSHIKIGNKFVKSLFIFTYPRYLTSGWFNPIINSPDLLDISIYVHPIDTVTALKNLRKKTAQIEAQLMERQEKGLVRDPILETAFRDIEGLRDQLQQAQERLFNVGTYITMYASSVPELNKMEEKFTSTLESQLVYAKPATFQQMEGFSSSLPLNQDQLLTHTPLNSGPVSSFFPFISMDLTSDEGTLFGVNRHNNTLIIFDRFSLENANLVCFAKSGSGKSFSMKLEIIRSMMMGVDVLVVDPENEYQKLAESVGGSYFRISLSSENQINPFDIPIIPEGEETADVFKSHILNLSGLVKLMLGKCPRRKMQCLTGQSPKLTLPATSQLIKKISRGLLRRF